MRPSVLVREASNGSMPSISPEECWMQVCRETPSFTVLRSVLVRRAGSGRGLWNYSSKEYLGKVCSETLSLTVLLSVLVRMADANVDSVTDLQVPAMGFRDGFKMARAVDVIPNRLRTSQGVFKSMASHMFLTGMQIHVNTCFK